MINTNIHNDDNKSYSTSFRDVLTDNSTTKLYPS